MAARGFQASKAGRSPRFVPRFVTLEERCVPATYHVDPALAGKADGDAVTFEAGRAAAIPGLLFAGSAKSALANPTWTAFGSFRAALDAADTIVLARGAVPLDNSATTLSLGVGKGFVNSVPVTQSLTLVGSTADSSVATRVTPTADTQFDDGTGAVADEFTSVFRVSGPDAALTASNFVFEGAAHKAGAGFAVRDGASARFDGVAVTGVAFGSAGASVAGDAAKSLTFANGRLEGYGRVGLLFVATPGSVSNSVVFGAGSASRVTNGIELQNGAAVSVTGSAVTANAGVAADGSLGSGLLVTEGSKAFAVGNVFERNGVALNVGAVTPDNSTLDAAFNTIAGNDYGAFGGLSIAAQNLANNWWDDARGPAKGSGPGSARRNGIDSAAKLSVQPFLSYPTPQLSPADVSSFAAAQADYLRLVTTLGVVVTPTAATPSAVTFAVTFPVAVVANTVEPAALRPLSAADFAVTAPAGAAVTLSGSGTSYTLSVSGLGGSGVVTASLPARAAIDPATGRLTAASNAATATVPAPNAAPTLTGDFADQLIDSGGYSSEQSFTVGDDATAVGNLTLSATSSDPSFVPAVNVKFGGVNASRTVRIFAPPRDPQEYVPYPAGSSVITVTVTDAEGLTASRTFRVERVNTPPRVTPLPDINLPRPPSNPVFFVVDDDQSSNSNLTLTVTSSRPEVLAPEDARVFYANRHPSFSADTARAYGSTVVTLTFTDPQGLSASRSFVATRPSPPPGIFGPLPDLTLGPATTTVVPFVAGFADALSTVLTVTSSNPAVVPASSLTLLHPSNGGGDNSLTVAGLPGVPGSSTITLTASDSRGLTATRSFVITVPATSPPVVVPKRTRLFAVAADAGGRPEVQVFDANGKPTTRFLAFAAGFTGGVRVATADFDNDGTDDIVVAAGPGGGPHVRVVSGATGAELASFFAFDPSFRGGVFVAAADLTGGGTPSIVVAAGAGGGPHVKVVALNGVASQSFFAFDAGFTGGVTVAAADLDGDGRAEVVVAAGAGGGPHVKAFTFASGVPAVTQSYYAFDAGFTGGVYVAAGTFGVAAAQGVGGSGEVRLLNGGTFPAYAAGFTGGVRLGVADLGGDGVDEILTAAGPGGGPHVRAFTATGTPAFGALAFDKLDPTGYFIG